MAAISISTAVSNEESLSWAQRFGQEALDFAMYSAPSIIGSAAYSFLNTGISIGNTFGADWEERDLAEDLQTAGRPDGYLANAGEYYSERKSIMDVGGLIAGSILPGTLAVRALRGVQAGRQLKAAGEIAGKTRPWYRQTSVNSTQMNKLTKSIKEETRINELAGKEKLRLLGAGMKQQAMEAGVYEMATLATMAQNSSFDNEDMNYFETIGANLRHVAFGTALGGGIGGGLQYLGEFGKLKGLLRTNNQKVGNIGRAIDEDVLRDKDGNLLAATVPGDAIGNSINGLFGVSDKKRSLYGILSGELEEFNGLKFNIGSATELRNAVETTTEKTFLQIRSDLKAISDDDEIRKQLFRQILPVAPDSSAAKHQIPRRMADINFGTAQGIEGLRKNAKVMFGLERANPIQFKPDDFAAQSVKINSGIAADDFLFEDAVVDLLPKDFKVQYLDAKQKKMPLPEMSGELIEQIQKNSRGRITSIMNYVAAGNRLNEKTDKATYNAFKVLLSTADKSLVSDLVKQRGRVGGITGQTIKEMQDNLVTQNPALKNVQNIMEDIQFNDVLADEVIRKYRLADHEELGRILEIADSTLNNPEKLIEGVQLYARKNKTRFSADGTLTDVKHRRLSGLVSDPIFRKGQLSSKAVLDTKSGNIIKEGFAPTVMDLPVAVRNKIDVSNYKKGVDTPYNNSVKFLAAQKSLLSDKKTLDQARFNGVDINKDSIQFLDAAVINLKAAKKADAGKNTTKAFDRVNEQLFTKDNKSLIFNVDIPGEGKTTVTASNYEELVNLTTDIKQGLIRRELDENISRPAAKQLNAEQIAIKYNVSPRAVYEINKPKLSPDLEDGLGYYTRMDSEEIYHIDMNYTKQGVVDDGKLQGIAHVHARNTVNQEYADAVVADILGEDFDVQLLQNARESQRNFAENAAPVDSGAGILASGQGDLGQLDLYSTTIGKNTATIESKTKKAISDTVETSGVAVVDDPKGLAELAVINQRLRQGDYAFADNLDPAVQKMVQRNIGEDLTPESIMVNKEILFLNDDLVRAVANENKEATEQALQKISNLMAENQAATFPVNAPTATQFLRDYHEANREFVINRIKKLDYATGEANQWDPRVVYPGKFDTKRFNHFYILQDPAEKLGNGSIKSQGFITAPSKDLLDQKLEAMQRMRAKQGLPSLNKMTQQSLEDFRKAIDDYDTSLVIRDEFVDSSLESNNKLFDYMPEPSKEVVNEMVNSLLSNASNVVKKSVALKYTKEINTLKQYDKTALDSTFGKKGQKSAFAKQINTMLNISNKSDYKKLQTTQETFDDAVSSAYFKIRGMAETAMSGLKLPKGSKKFKVAQQKELAAWEEMNGMLKAHGFPTPFDDVKDIIIANTNAPRRIVEGFVAKANGLLATSLLRWDTAQAIVNSMSTPLMLMPELQTLRKNLTDSEILRTLGAKSNVQVGDFKMATNLKLMQQAVADMWKPGLLENYKQRGITTSILQELRDAAGEIGYRAGESTTKWGDRLSAVSEKLSYLTDKSEELTKFVAARSAELQLDEFAAAGMKLDAATREAIIKSIVTKVHGNYTASQRPALFQGAIGQAVGLFQTYQFNLMQRAATHWMTGNRGSVARMLAAQSSIFGAQSVPGFQMMNDYVAKETAGEKDFYSETLSKLGPVGEVMLYGFGSNLTAPIFGTGIDFFTRGDLTPRTPIILPTSLSEIPIVNFANRVSGNLMRTMKQITGGADISESLGQAFAHNGFNRPLQGAAQIFWTGDRTTNKGTTLAKYQNPFDPDTMSVLNFVNAGAKLLGTQTTDEQIAVNAMYRSLEYRTERYDKLARLGSTVRTNIRAAEGDNGRLTRQEVHKTLGRYVESGGNIRTFQQWMGNNYVNATESQLRQLSNGNNNESKYLYSILEANPGSFD